MHVDKYAFSFNNLYSLYLYVRGNQIIKYEKLHLGPKPEVSIIEATVFPYILLGTSEE